jgi:hypothetical protein
VVEPLLLRKTVHFLAGADRRRRYARLAHKSRRDVRLSQRCKSKANS